MRCRVLSLSFLLLLSIPTAAVLLHDPAQAQSCDAEEAKKREEEKKKKKPCDHVWGDEISASTKLSGRDCTITMYSKTCSKCRTTAHRDESTGSDCP